MSAPGKSPWEPELLQLMCYSLLIFIKLFVVSPRKTLQNPLVCSAEPSASNFMTFTFSDTLSFVDFFFIKLSSVRETLFGFLLRIPISLPPFYFITRIEFINILCGIITLYLPN